MSARPSYWIPVGWHAPTNDGLGTITELHSQSGVLVLPYSEGVRFRGDDYNVKRIHGAWSRHIPEKKARYRVEVSDRTFDVEPVRLGTVQVYQFFLVPLRTARTQVCLRRNEVLHGVAHNTGARNPYTFCGISEYLHQHLNVTTNQFETHYDEHFARGETPTCKACLTHYAVWCLFVVLPHTKKDVVVKRVAKEKSAEEKRLRLPTAYDRILDDELFERPTYKPVKPPASPPEPVELDELLDDPRDRKRASAMDRNRRLQDAKARVGGHRRR